MQETGAAVTARSQGLDGLLEDTLAHTSFKDCTPGDVRHLVWLGTLIPGIHALIQRDCAPPLPPAAYADRGVYLREW